MGNISKIKECSFLKEKEFYSPFATFSNKSQGRDKVEEDCPMRTEFQRDRDRIIYSKAFIRLKNKTQVFFSPEGDHYMTRLTHTLDVSQIARSIARALNLNEDLTEAIALGHDLGHTPFGHSGERVLNKLSPYGFRHNEQSLRVVEVLEKDGEGLNLTREVRDGILNHKTSLTPSTLEGKVVRISDKIAYLNHDVEDAIRAGAICEEDLPKIVVEVLGTKTRERINAMITSVYLNSIDKNDILMSVEVETAMKELRTFMFERVYNTDLARGEEEKAGNMIEAMYETFKKYPEKMPKPYQKLLEKYSIDNVICDYISGMTDRYAIKTFTKLFIPENF